MSEFKIEKDIERPAIGERGKRSKYPFKQMEVNDSFFVELKTAREHARLRATAWAYGHRNDKSFSVYLEKGVGCRVFRNS